MTCIKEPYYCPDSKKKLSHEEFSSRYGEDAADLQRQIIEKRKELDDVTPWFDRKGWNEALEGVGFLIGALLCAPILVAMFGALAAAIVMAPAFIALLIIPGEMGSALIKGPKKF